jgi:hypothetical protein
VSDTIQPTPDGLPRSNVCGSASKYKKRSLECVLGELVVGSNPPADTQHHWTEPVDEFCKCRLIPILDKSGE